MKTAAQYEDDIEYLENHIEYLSDRIDRMTKVLEFISERDKDYQQRTLIGWALEEWKHY